MNDGNNSLEVGTRVQLLEHMAGVYKKAVPGAVGTIKAKKVDEGFDMVFIVWDQNHWRYNGEPDGWTFESHFEPTEKVNMFQALEDPKAFADNVADRIKDRSFDGDDEEAEYTQALDVYLDQLNEVVSLLSESNGFIVIASRDEVHHKDEGRIISVPYVYGSFLDQDTMLLLEMRMMQMGAEAQSEMAQKILRRLGQESEEENGW